MKKLSLGLIVLLSTVWAYGATSDTDAAPNINVSVSSESKDLATGYAAAFTKFRRVPFHVQLQHEGGKIIVINDIKSVSANGGVLLLETNKGLFYAINPKDIIWLSDAPVVQEKPNAADAK